LEVCFLRLFRHARIHLSARALLFGGLTFAFIPFIAACTSTASREPAPPTPAPATLAVPSPSPAASAASPVASPVAALADASQGMVNLTDAMKFDPATLTVTKGTTVTWRNSSQMVHTVTDDPAKASNKADAALPSGAEAWDSGDLNPGQTFSHTFDVPGTYKYFCIPHETLGMTATIIVTA